MSRKNERKDRQLPLDFEAVSAPTPAVCLEQKESSVVCFASYVRSKLPPSSSRDPVLDRLLREATRLSW